MQPIPDARLLTGLRDYIFRLKITGAHKICFILKLYIKWQQWFSNGFKYIKPEASESLSVMDLSLT